MHSFMVNGSASKRRDFVIAVDFKGLFEYLFG